MAVVTAHVNQSATIRALLADLPHVLVGTANQLQGMERPAAVVLHPLAGYRDPTTFGTDLGRACVMLSRHRAHLHVVTDTATPTVLSATRPAARCRLATARCSTRYSTTHRRHRPSRQQAFVRARPSHPVVGTPPPGGLSKRAFSEQGLKIGQPECQW